MTKVLEDDRENGLKINFPLRFLCRFIKKVSKSIPEVCESTNLYSGENGLANF